jgi:polysaccharide biosynthesis/export protein
LRLHTPAFLLLTGAILASCGSYKQNILFQVTPGEVEKQRSEAEANYVIRPNDLLTLELYTNQGEKIVDPNRESFKNGTIGASMPEPVQYLVDVNGLTKLPLIGQVRVEGLGIREAEEMLEKAYERFYEQAFVRLQFDNKRVIVLGAPGGQVIPLSHENMRLTEVLALAKGITSDARANNIRVLRDDKVFLADLSTFAGYQQNNLVMQPGDVVYVEPVRRPFIEAIRDYSPAISIVTSLATLIFIISVR